MMTILSRLIAPVAHAGPVAPSRFDSPEFHKWLAGQLQPFTLNDAALAAGFSASELTRDNCMRTSIALKKAGYQQFRRPYDSQFFWRVKPRNRQAGYYIPDLTPFFVALVVIGVLLGALLTEGVPWVWSLVKPWLHEVTR